MRRFLSLLACTALLLGLGLFAAPSGSALAAPAAKAPAYGSWREAYTAMLTDESARAAVIGKDADYRRSYFSGDPSALTPSAYAVADLNADGAPELLLYAEGTGLTDVFSFDGTLRYLGYDAFFGFLPEEGLAIVHGHWHGAGGSGDREWSAVPLFREDDWGRVYLDCMEDGGKLRYSFQEYGAFESTDWAKPGENPEAEERYEKLFDRCVRSCVRLEDIPFFSMDNLSGFVSPCELKYMRRLYNAVGTFPYAGEEFLREKRWEGLGLDIRDERPLGALLLDLDFDGVPELLLSNGCKKVSERASWIFRYDAMNDRMVCIGEGPDEALTNGRALYGCRTGGGEAVWTRYQKTLLRITEHRLDKAEVGYLEKYDAPAPLKWQDPDKLAEKILKGEY